MAWNMRVREGTTASVARRDLRLEGLGGKRYPTQDNLYLEQTLKFTGIGDAVQALTPFIDKATARAAGYETASFNLAAFTPNGLDDEV